VSAGVVFTCPLHRVWRGHGQRFVAEPPPATAPRPARVAVMLALAHKIRAGIAAGQLADQADAARLLGCTRARLTQLLDLLRLAPDLQEQVLFLETSRGLEPVTERSLRAVTKLPCWADQRRRFAALRDVCQSAY
jgi:hypothetical protein